MEDLLFAATLALIYTIATVMIPYVLVLVLINVIYRLLAGRYFRWVSWRTMLPFLLLFTGGWGIFFYGLMTQPVFVITH